MKIIQSLENSFESDRSLRRDLHSHPELSFDEHRTSKVVADRLNQLGIETHNVGGTGVVGVIRKGRSHRGVALRADMDALSIHESNKFSHASKYSGKMHACGHDGHTATLLAAAKVIANEILFDGNVVLVFQPAEETSGGALAMINDGLFDRFPVDAIFGFHNRPGVPLGQFTLRPGASSAASVNFKITLTGQGCHAAMPHLGIDPIPSACQMILGFQSIISRSIKSIDAGLISVTMIKAGESQNVISPTCTLKGTARGGSDELLNSIIKRMESIASLTAQAYNVENKIEWANYCPSVVNHSNESSFLRNLMTDLVGKERIHDREFTMGSEDFGYYLKIKPGSYFGIGNGNGDHRSENHGDGPCLLHNSSYDFNDGIIPIGATFWSKLVERYLKP